MYCFFSLNWSTFVVNKNNDMMNMSISMSITVENYLKKINKKDLIN